ncbi:TraR/DksA family transcriptional regulator [Sinorhizobium meliloti]|nr:TraR/DksA family transcriptional regulator [Sinorhizobium meliloti]
MSGADEKDFDLAEKIAERQREAAIRRARLALAVEGTFDCQDRPNEIEAARREAVPSARRCIAYQRHYEREKGKRG